MSMKLYIFLFLLVLISCNSEQNNIYSIFPKDSELTYLDLCNSEQLIIDEDFVIISYNISKHWDTYDPHILFYNKSLRLVSASYYPSENIDSMRNGVIYGVLNESRNNRKYWYKNELPENFRFSFITKKKKGIGRMSNKIAKNIILKDRKVIFYVRKSDNKYIGLKNKRMENDSILLKDYKEADTLVYNISDLHFKYKEMIISLKKYDIEKNNYLWDEIIVKNKDIYDNFYKQLWNSINSK